MYLHHLKWLIRCLKRVHGKQYRMKDWSTLHFSSIFGDNDIYRRDNSVHLRSFLLARRVFLLRLPVVTTCQSTTDYNSSVRACSAIFSPDPPRVASLPTSREFRAAQENDSALQKWIAHHKASTFRFRPELVNTLTASCFWG